MDHLAYAIVLAPAAIFIIAAAMMLSAKKSADVDETMINNIDRKQASGRFIIFLSYPATSFIYGIMTVFLIYQSTGSFSVPEDLKATCIITLVCYCLSCAIKGLIGSIEIAKGALYNNEFGKSTVKLCMPEIISLLGIMFFFMKYTQMC